MVEVVCTARYPGGHCTRPVKTKALCNAHYQQRQSGKSFTPPREFKPLRKRGVTSLRNEDGDKHCPACDCWLPTSSFATTTRSGDGLHTRCSSCDRSRHLRNNYGITYEEYTVLWEKQHLKCAVCKTTRATGRNWHVDHDHETGQVRGILCGRCNVGLGMFVDNADYLRSAITYLEVTI